MLKYTTNKSRHFLNHVNQGVSWNRFVIICFLFASNMLMGQTVYYDSSPLEGSNIAVGDSTEYIDPICTESGGVYTCTSDLLECSYRSFIELVINPLNPADLLLGYVPDTLYTLAIVYDLEYLNSSGILETMTGESITAEFTLNGGDFKNRMVKFYDDKKHLVKAKVTSVNVINSLSNAVPSSAILRAGAEIERYSSLDVSSNDDDLTLTLSGDASYIHVDIPLDDGAQSYDLEWTWIDDELKTGYTPAYDFKRNSTRINTFVPSYKISNIYRNGIILARYRKVGYVDHGGAEDCEKLYLSPWNIINDTGDVPTGSGNKLLIEDTHREELNWQHSRSYAEEGKSKDVISYFDGSLRSRQTLSKLESEDHIIGAESIYDHIGRPAIQILPSPVINAQDDYQTKIDFVPALNKSSANPNAAYSYKDFELFDQGNICETDVKPLSTNSGSAQYYSSDNEVDGVGKEQDYVPNAHGYPFSHTMFTQDGTGRVQFQGGVGTDHQIFGGHDTRYFYSVPSQGELDRLFGIEAGYARYYQKNMVVDPNGQVSVSYLDNKGRVIATALAGETPSSVDALDSHAGGTFNIVEDVAINNQKINSDFGYSYIINQGVSITKDGTLFDLDYSMNKLDFELPECAPDICFDCEYELKIKVTDQCEAIVLGSDTTLTIRHIGDQSDTQCEAPGDEAYVKSDLQTTLDVGSYNVSKILRLDGEKMKEFEELYVAHDTCISTVAELFESLLSDIDLSTCFNMGNCPNDCVEQTPLIPGEDIDEYRKRLLECINACPILENTESGPTQCELLLEGMLADLSPFGVYGGISLDANGEVENIDPTHPQCLSIYYDTQEFDKLVAADPNSDGPEYPYMRISYIHYNEDGTPVLDQNSNHVPISMTINEVTFTPDELPLSLFLQYWEPHWAYNLLTLHPEYPTYVWCQDTTIANAMAFEEDFLAISTFDEANALGYLNPLGLTNVPTITGLTINGTTATDPFAGQMTGENMHTTYNVDGDNITIDIWELAYLTAIGNLIEVDALLAGLDENDLGSNWITDISDPSQGGVGLCNADRFWEAFKLLYIQSIRRDYLLANLNTYTEEGGLYEDYAQIQSRLGADCTCCDVSNCEGACDDACDICIDYGRAKKRYGNELNGMDEDTGDEFPASSAASAIEACENNCSAYRSDWLTQYVHCWDSEWDKSQPVLDDPNATVGQPGYIPANYRELFDVYEGICATGCMYDLETEGVAIEHMMGSSTLPEGHMGYVHDLDGDTTTTVDQTTYFSFEHAFELIIGTPTEECNALKVNAPLPYDTDMFAGEMPYIEPCVCDNYNYVFNLYEESLSGGQLADLDGFVEYLEDNFDYEDGKESVADLDCACRLPSAFMRDVPVSSAPIPTMFACKSCVTCPQMVEVVNAFNVSDYGMLFDSVQGPLYFNENFREVFTNWTNAYLNFNLTFSEYFDYMSYCGIPPGFMDPGSGMLVGNGSDQQVFGSSSMHQKSKTTSLRSTSSLDGQVSLSVDVVQEVAQAGDEVTIKVEMTNLTTTEITGLEFSLLLPAGWLYTSNPVGTIDALNNSLLTHSSISLEGEEEVSWTFTTEVPGAIYLSKNYHTIANLGDGVSDPDPLEANDAIYVEIPDPCLQEVETSDDMATFLNLVIEEYIKMVALGENPCDGIPLANIAGYETSTINKWKHIGIENQKVEVCVGNYDTNAADDYVLTFVNSCSNTTDCEFVIYNIEDLNYIFHEDLARAKIKAVSAAHNYNFSIDHELEVEYVDSRFDLILTLKASSNGGCFSFEPCEKRLLCNRSVAIPLSVEENQCINDVLDITQMQAVYELEERIQNSRETFRREYVSQCLNRDSLEESLIYTSPSTEHHYTLYYYDQSGSLVKTIPPKGVIPLTPAQVDTVGGYRDGTVFSPQESDIYPGHKMPTKYRYNSFGQIDEQNSPDLNVKTEFWYDKLGRPVLSQDGRQKQMIGHVYSYTLYDKLGRAIEVGELTHSKSFESYLDTLYPNVDYQIVEEADVVDFVNTTFNRVNIIRSIYDKDFEYEDDNNQMISVDSKFGTSRLYLRKRISSSIFIEEFTYDASIGIDASINKAYKYATHYDYDIHGNAKTVLQEFRELEGVSNSIKRIDYTFDLISGNVHEVAYQKGHLDQFFHRYSYDADNRIKSVRTSTDGFIWDNDAHYTYYDHGPLARMDIGDFEVQGCDYIYTIHGWIKAVNATNLFEENDPGGDGYSLDPLHANVANDAYAFSLHYYDGDYDGIRAVEADFAGSVPAGLNNLYNGNISKMNTALRDMTNTAIEVTPNLYTYDQLHRIKEMKKFEPIDISGSTYTWVLGNNTSYGTTYSYDPNGNLEQLTRKDTLGQLYDSLTYNYTSGYSNRLDYVSDAVSNTADNNLQGQSSNNYLYDWSGNITSNTSEQIQKLKWDQYGKIREIRRNGGATVARPELDYHYDAMGNRIVKVVDKGGAILEYTFYVRDASGNVLAVYNATEGAGREIDELYLGEHHLFGSNRLGIKHADNPVLDLSDSMANPLFLEELSRMAGKRSYEMTNHLSNVLSTISDNKLLSEGSTEYRPEILSYSDYYPFGWKMPDRSDAQLGHRYGFNGKEMDDEVKGEGVQYDYGFRIYDSRIARFLSVDPLTKSYPNLTPYQFAHDSPIYFIDLDGLEGEPGAERMIRQQLSTALSNKSGERVDRVYQKILKAEGDKTQYAGYAAMVPLVVIGAAEGGIAWMFWRVAGSIYTNPFIINEGSAFIWGLGTDQEYPIITSFSDNLSKSGRQLVTRSIVQGVEMIEENSKLLAIWNNTLRKATESKKDNIYKRYLNALEDGSISNWSNDELSKTFSYIRDKFKNMAAKEGIEIKGQIHHWNYPKFDFPDQVANPSNLTTPVSRADHQKIHEQTSSTSNIWKGPIKEELIKTVKSTPYTPPPNGG